MDHERTNLTGTGREIVENASDELLDELSDPSSDERWETQSEEFDYYSPPNPPRFYLRANLGLQSSPSSRSSPTSPNTEMHEGQEDALTDLLATFQINVPHPTQALGSVDDDYDDDSDLSSGSFDERPATAPYHLQTLPAVRNDASNSNSDLSSGFSFELEERLASPPVATPDHGPLPPPGSTEQRDAVAQRGSPPRIEITVDGANNSISVVSSGPVAVTANFKAAVTDHNVSRNHSPLPLPQQMREFQTLTSTYPMFSPIHESPFPMSNMLHPFRGSRSSAVSSSSSVSSRSTTPALSDLGLENEPMPTYPSSFLRRYHSYQLDQRAYSTSQPFSNAEGLQGIPAPVPAQPSPTESSPAANSLEQQPADHTISQSDGPKNDLAPIQIPRLISPIPRRSVNRFATPRLYRSLSAPVLRATAASLHRAPTEDDLCVQPDFIASASSDEVLSPNANKPSNAPNQYISPIPSAHMPSQPSQDSSGPIIIRCQVPKRIGAKIFSRSTQILKASGCSLVVNGQGQTRNRIEEEYKKLGWEPPRECLLKMEASSLANASKVS